MNNNKAALKSGIWYTISTFLVSGLNFLITPIFSRIMSQNDYGDYNNFTSWLSILTILCTLNLSATMIRAKYDFEEDYSSYTKTMILLGMICTLVIATLVNIFSVPFENLFAMTRPFSNMIFVYLLFAPAMSIFQVINRIEYKYKFVSFLSFFSVFCTICISLILVIIFENDYQARAIGFIFPNTVLNIIICILLLQRKGKIKIKYAKYALIISLPYLPHLLAGNLLGTMDRVMIKQFCGGVDTALYSLPHNCAIVISLFWTALNMAYNPWLAEKLHNREYFQIRKYSKYYILVFLIPVLGLLIFAPELLWIMGGDRYLEGKYVMPPLIIGCLFQFIYSMYVNIEQFEKKTVGMAVGTVIAALVNGILNYIFIPRFGYIAAAYTTMIGYFILMLIHYFLVRKMGLSTVYDTKYTTMIVVLGFIAMGITNIIYTMNTARYCIGLLYIIAILFVIRKYWKQFAPIIFERLAKKENDKL